MSSKITREQRREALKEDYKNKGKSGRNWYLMDGNDMEESFGIKPFVPEEGSVFIAVLERWEDPKFFMELFIHYNIGSDKHAFLCSDKMLGETCSICAFRNELKTQGEPEDIYNEYKWTRRYLMWIVNTETKRTINQGVMIYDAPMTVKNGILDVCADSRTGNIIDPSDVSENVNIVFKRIGRKGYQFTEYKGFKLEKREDVIPEEYFDLPEMKELIVYPDVSEMKKCLGLPVENSKRKITPEQRELLGGDKPVRKLYQKENIDENDEKPRFPHRGARTEEEEKKLVTKDMPEPNEDEETDPFDPKRYSDKSNNDEASERQKVLERTRNRLKDRGRER